MIDCNEWKTGTPRIHKRDESKTTRIMMTTVHHVTSSLGLRKFEAAWFLLNRRYMRVKRLKWAGQAVRIFDKKNPWTNTGKFFGGRRATGKARYRFIRKGEVKMNTVKLLIRKNWRAAAGHEWLEEENGERRGQGSGRRAIGIIIIMIIIINFTPLFKKERKAGIRHHTLCVCVCVCVFFQFANRLVESNKTWCQH